jgi:capsular exopolysaccharide synthesis family protein
MEPPAATASEGFDKEDASYVRIVEECNLLQGLCNSLLETMKGIDVDAPRDGITIHVLERAVPATKPYSPDEARIMGIGLAIGVMLGTGLAFVRDWADKSVRSADEITAILGVPVLGAIPKTPKRKLIRQGGRIRFESHSRESEAYRTIRTGLLYGLSDDKKAKTLLVTSPGALEGKTTLVSNLGAAMAHAGQKTLIIDADLRKPMQQRIFAMKETGKGLTDLLAREAGLDEVIRSTDIDGLHVLASGENAANPSELLNGREFARGWDEIKGKYDRILVDSSPVGIVSDAQILANLCDLTLLVLRAKRTSRIITQRARDALTTVGASLAGAVVNDVAKRDHRYSHYSGYGPYYGTSAKQRRSAPTRKQLPVCAGSSDKSERPLHAAVDRILGTDNRPSLGEPKKEA